MASTRGRQVVIPLTNKSGGSVIAGDVVVVDASNNDAFTTDTSGGFTGGIGVAQEAIANNAIGRILIGGYASLVNVNASVTRGQYGKTHTVAKQATGAAARGVGTFCEWLTGGTTPDAIVYPVDLLGSSLTDPTTTRGDIITRGASAIQRLALGAAGKGLRSDGTDALWAYPPGYEFDYAQWTAGVNITATTEATANTIVTGGAVTYDGSTVVEIEFFIPASTKGTTFTQFWLYDGASSIGAIGVQSAAGGTSLTLKRRLTPSAAAHTYSLRGSVDAATGTATGGAGGAAAYVPGFERITKAA